MSVHSSLQQRIFQLGSNHGAEFENLALDIFQFQYANCAVYRQYTDALKITPASVTSIAQIPFLPIGFFKTQTVVSNEKPIQTSFSSSGTTGETTSKHHITDVSIYETSFLKAFEQFYGQPGNYCIMALLPSYLEREGSSLIYMADRLIQLSKHPQSGFYLNNLNELADKLKTLNQQEQKCLLLGVSFALLDLAEQFPQPLPYTTIMETGGMKGRRKELLRVELHDILKNAFGVTAIHSEYGMTELLSQAYSKGGGLFHCPPWMKVMVRDINDPFSLLPDGKSGGINVIDLANINSCSFIATQDLGVIRDDNTFEILGRYDNSDVRGCNLMVV